ncbi:MAG: hypothetical protein HYZ34_11305 [Ignavibacteriae bacterium]|nr:hypothetical protein [Ignavibacteriota bacterium]
MQTVTLESLQQKAINVLNVSQEDFLKSSIRSLLQEKLRSINIERIATCRKYNVTSIEELDNLIREGKVNEFLVDEDFQHVDFLTWKVKELESLIVEPD